MRSGPWSSVKFLVLSTWVPALWSPLNGVTEPAQPALTAAASGGLDVALVPRKPKWRIWNLDHEEVELRFRRQPLDLHIHDLDGPLRFDSDIRCGVRQTANRRRPGRAHHLE